MTFNVVVIAGLKGGSGKSLLTAGLAEFWGEPVTVVDADNERSTLRVTTWLDKLAKKGTDPSHVTWSESTPGELADALSSIKGTILVDTAGKKANNDLFALAKVADLVLIPGRTNEVESVVETYTTLKTGLNPTPKMGMVLSETNPRANPSAMKGEIADAARIVRSASSLPLLGSVPGYSGLRWAITYGLPISSITGRPGEKLATRFQEIATNVKEALNG